MPETEGNELSMDELKDVSGGLKGDDRGTYGVCNGGNRVSPNQLKGDMGLGGLGKRKDSVVRKSRVVEELGDGDIE